MKRKVYRDFYNRATLKVARELLGKYLVLKKDGKILCFSCLPSPRLGRKYPSGQGRLCRNVILSPDLSRRRISISQLISRCRIRIETIRFFPRLWRGQNDKTGTFGGYDTVSGDLTVT